MSEPIFLDNLSTTPTDPKVIEEMLPFLHGKFGNPHSEHVYGWSAAQSIDEAAKRVSALIGAVPSEIVFTSGATEANNMALQGVMRSKERRGDHMIVSAIEHKCVLNTAEHLGEAGFEVDIVPVSRSGVVDLTQVQELLREDTALVSVMLANNEIGTVQPVAEIGALCRAQGIVLHTDAAQAVGKLPVDVTELNVDLMSISAHKLYGPKGVGSLFVSRSIPYRLSPLMIGGGQQEGRRAGTLPTFLCVGFGAACAIAIHRMEDDRQNVSALRNRFLSALEARGVAFEHNGSQADQLDGCINIQFEEIEADVLLTRLQNDLSASTGSACNAGIYEDSYVLSALGLVSDEIGRSVRFGLGRFTTENDVDDAARVIADVLGKRTSNRPQPALSGAVHQGAS